MCGPLPLMELWAVWLLHTSTCPGRWNATSHKAGADREFTQ
jgi:hypothetical protein